MDKPIFIAGSGRCGTTILQVLLSQHRHIFGLRYEGRFIVSPGGLLTVLRSGNYASAMAEFRHKVLHEWHQVVIGNGTNQKYIGGLCADVGRRDIERLVDELEARLSHTTDEVQAIKHARHFIDQFFADAMRGRERRRWLEKTPSNLLYMNELLSLYPRAQFIHIIRDGRDVASSIIEKGFWPIWKFDLPLLFDSINDRTVSNCARFWREVVTSGRKIGGTSMPNGSYFEVRLEDILRAPKETLGGICEFLGERFDQNMLSVSLKGGHCGRWRETFTAQDVADFKEQAGDLLVELGYERAGDW